MRLDVVVVVGDHADLRLDLGHRAAHALIPRDTDDASQRINRRLTRPLRRNRRDPQRVSIPTVGRAEWDRTFAATGRGLRTLETEPGTTIGELAQRALELSGQDRTEVHKVWTEDAVTGQRLDDDAQVASALDPGDLVLVNAEVPPKAMYSLAPLGRPEELFSVLHVAAALEVAAWPRLWGALLYTEEDADLATYVRTYFDELNALSGPHLRLFVVERPPDWKRAKKYWRAQLEPPLLRSLSAMRWLTTMPYDKSGLYDVAREFGVTPDQFPCLVLFGGASDGTVIFPIRSATPDSLRGLFGTILGAIGDEPTDYRLQKAYDRTRDAGAAAPSVHGAAALQALAASASWADRAALARVEAAKQAVLRTEFHGPNVVVAHGHLSDITFHGPTTLINQPVDTVITDFQNTHTSVPGTQLAEVLRLVLTSNDLAPEDKVDLARQVTEAVRWFESDDESERRVAKYALGGIHSVAVRGEDIAWSVMDILRTIETQSHSTGDTDT